MSRQDNDPDNQSGQAYFYDFINIIAISYPYASLRLIEIEVAFARAVGPVAAQLKSVTQGVFEMIIPIGFGHQARIELEFDSKGRLQPVMGEIIGR